MSGMRLKIWYRSGGYEQLDLTADLPSGWSLAHAVFTDAVCNDRVQCAELHRPDGSVLDAFMRPPET